MDLETFKKHVASTIHACHFEGVFDGDEHMKYLCTKINVDNEKVTAYFIETEGFTVKKALQAHQAMHTPFSVMLYNMAGECLGPYIENKYIDTVSFNLDWASNEALTTKVTFK